jgi:hypothetical protein
VIETERVLFGGRLGIEWVRVWLEYRAGSIVLASHDIGPGLEHAFGKDDIETYLEVDAIHLPNLTAPCAPNGPNRTRRWTPSSCWPPATAATDRYDRTSHLAHRGRHPVSGSPSSDAVPVRRPIRRGSKATRLPAACRTGSSSPGSMRYAS